MAHAGTANPCRVTERAKMSTQTAKDLLNSGKSDAYPFLDEVEFPADMPARISASIP